jgi:hypothetical protein
VFYDITPIRVTFTSSTSPSSSNSISTTNGSTTVVFTLIGHGCDTGTYVTISGVSGNPGGVPDAEINIEHEVVRIDADNFSITVTTAATSTTSAQGGTGISIACQINPGFASTTAGYGWGVANGMETMAGVYLVQRRLLCFKEIGSLITLTTTL